MKKKLFLFLFVGLIWGPLWAQTSAAAEDSEAAGFGGSSQGYLFLYDLNGNQYDHTFSLTGEGCRLYWDHFAVGGFGKAVIGPQTRLGYGGLILGYVQREESFQFEALSYTGFGGGAIFGSGLAAVSQELRLRFLFPVAGFVLPGVSLGFGYQGSLIPWTYDLDALEASVSFVLNFG